MSAEAGPTLKAFFDAARVRVLGGLLHDAEPTFPLATEQRLHRGPRRHRPRGRLPRKT